MKKTRNELSAELLILPDGRILVQNLTQPMAELLHNLNPADEVISRRTLQKSTLTHTPFQNLVGAEVTRLKLKES